MTFIIILLCLMCVESGEAKSLFYTSWGQKYEQGTSNFELGGKYWLSTDRVDIDGSQESYPANQQFSYADIFFSYNYFFYPHLQMGIAGSGRSVTYLSDNDSHSVSSMNNIDIVFRYFLEAEKRWHWGFSFRYSQKLFSNGDINSVPIDDDISWMEVRCLNTYYFSKHWISNMGVGYRRFSELQSAEVTYAVDLAYLGGRVDLYAGVSGVEATKQDVYSVNPSLKPPIGIYSSSLFNSINRRFLDAHAGIIFKGKKWGLKAEGGRRVLGRSTDLGFFAALSLIRTRAGTSAKFIKTAKFKEYDIEGEVMKISPRGKYLKINIGLAKDLDLNMRVDIFKTDFFGGNILIATGVVKELKASWSIIRLVKRYNNIKIEKGFTARAY